jgi:hypothetical protein
MDSTPIKLILSNITILSLKDTLEKSKNLNNSYLLKRKLPELPELPESINEQKCKKRKQLTRSASAPL